MRRKQQGWQVGREFGPRALLIAALVGAIQGPSLMAAAQEMPAAPVAPASRGPMEMKVRRLPDTVELVIVGTGSAPQLQQATRGATWQGLLVTGRPTGLRLGPQRLSLPEAGLQTISLDGTGTTYRIEVTPMPGFPVGRPVVSADGRNLILSFSAPAQASLDTLTPNLRRPGRVAQSSFVPPLQPRAVAPPVGDMAVGTMTIVNPSYVNVSGPPVTMTLRNAPAKDVLMALSQLGGYGFVYVEDAASPGATPQQAALGNQGQMSSGSAAGSMRPISIAFRNESYGRAVNSALLASGLQGKREGNIILAGPNVLGKSFGAQLSKVYRLNQVPANAAAD
jgi:type IV pilus assembly protein PilQ